MGTEEVYHSSLTSLTEYIILYYIEGGLGPTDRLHHRRRSVVRCDFTVAEPTAGTTE